MAGEDCGNPGVAVGTIELIRHDTFRTRGYHTLITSYRERKKSDHTQSRNCLVREDEGAYSRDCPRRIEARSARPEGLVSFDGEHGADSLLEKSGLTGCDPQDFAAIADRACRSHGTEKPNLSRTIKTMQRYGLVEVTQQKNGRLAPKVAYKRVKLTMELGA